MKTAQVPHKAVRIALVAATLFPVCLAQAELPPTSAGFPDPTYGTRGAQAFSVRSGFEEVRAIVPATDGRWLISGYASSVGGNNPIRFLAQLQPDGRFDRTFGTDGLVVDKHYPNLLAVQSTGKILATNYPDDASAVLERLLPDGTRDTAFGVSDGRTILPATTEAPQQNFESIGIDGQGRIFATTHLYRRGFDNVGYVVVWRFSADGVPDASFGGAGRVQLDELLPVAFNSMVREQFDGKLVIVSWCVPAVSSTIARGCLVRLNPDGTRDVTFGPNGIRQLVAPGNTFYGFYDLAVAQGGKIYVAGSQVDLDSGGTVSHPIVVRLNNDGTADSTYGQGGIFTIASAAKTSVVNAVRVLADGRQIAIGAGGAGLGYLDSGFVARVTTSGELDPTFGIGGFAPIPMTQPHAFRLGAVLDDGAILAVGNQLSAYTMLFDEFDDADSLLVRIIGVETTTPVVEFFNTLLNHYFITADPLEAASIDAGASGPGWTRTGKKFKSGGPSRACRFRGSPDMDPITGMRSGPNSHVYSLEAPECLAIHADPGWRFESYDFSGWLRTSATCPEGTLGVYRTYNGRFAQNDSNHRYTIEAPVYNDMLAVGWIGDGVVFCAVQ